MTTATIGLALIVLAAVLQAGFLLRRENRRDPVSHWLLLAAAVSCSLPRSSNGASASASWP